MTGAARGLGAAIAGELHRRGASVCLADLDVTGARERARDLDPSERRAWAAALDVRSRESIRQVMADAAERSGSIDVLVNNAARVAPASLWEIDAEEWDDVLAVNLRGPLLAIQEVAPPMRANGWGRIVNIASIAGQQGGIVGGAHYSASKAGLLALTKVAARELATDGVTVNAVAPAAIESPALTGLPPRRLDEITSSIPVGRLGRPHEVAAVVAFLASDEAGYITGATFDVNGGLFMR